MTAVTFNPAAFKARYPRFAAVSDLTLSMFFAEAGIYMPDPETLGFSAQLAYPNGGQTLATDLGVSPAPSYVVTILSDAQADLTRAEMLLYMLTAHIGELSGVLSADGSARPVGQITGAGEGSVNATFQAEPGSGVWFKQTQPGAAFWRATTAARAFLYVPGC